MPRTTIPICSIYHVSLFSRKEGVTKRLVDWLIIVLTVRVRSCPQGFVRGQYGAVLLKFDDAVFQFSRVQSNFLLLADQCPRMQAPSDGSRFQKKSLCIRMRSSLTKRAPNMKTPGYRVRSDLNVISLIGCLRCSLFKSSGNIVGYILIIVVQRTTAIICWVSSARLWSLVWVHHRTNFPFPNIKTSFDWMSFCTSPTWTRSSSCSRLCLHLHMIFSRLQRTLNWNLTYTTSSLYLYVHPDDLSALIAAHRDCKAHSFALKKIIYSLCSSTVTTTTRIKCRSITNERHCASMSTFTESSGNEQSSDCRTEMDLVWFIGDDDAIKSEWWKLCCPCGGDYRVSLSWSIRWSQ